MGKYGKACKKAWRCKGKHEKALLERVTDVWVDGSGGASKAVREALVNAFIHRCLEHIKRNIKSERKKNNPDAKKRRLDKAKSAILDAIIDRVMTSADFPSNAEFEACWKDAFARLEDPNDWGSPLFLKYLSKYSLDENHCAPQNSWRIESILAVVFQEVQLVGDKAKAFGVAMASRLMGWMIYVKTMTC